MTLTGLKSIAQKLRTMIDARSAPLGATSEGRDWCIKALHPSDPLNEIHGIPDESSVPSVFVGYNSQFTIHPPAAAADSWGFDLTLLPHPVCFAHVLAYDEAVVHALETNFNNPQLTGATHSEKYEAFRALAQRWRLAYMGITIVQDAPALTNQGSIVACQTPAKPNYFSVGDLSTVAVSGYQAPLTMYWQTADKPDFTKAQSMPNSYAGASKDGLYMPLRLTRTHQQWHGSNDECTNSGVRNSAPVGDKYGYAAITLNAYKGWPFSDATTGLSSPHLAAAGGTMNPGEMTSPMCNDVFGHVSVLNCALTTKFRCFIRVGFELQVQPGTLLTPHQSLSPKYDPQAIEAYFMMNREFKDAYPEEYNSVSKLWEVISSVAKTVAPALSFIPGVGPILATAVPQIAAVGDRIKDAIADKNTASMADTQLASQAIRDVIEPAVTYIRKAKKKVRMPVGIKLRPRARSSPARG